MTHADRPLIVGAGPVGLGAALFLARQGRTPRLVEMRDEPSRHSKALAVNPRTLDILEPTGVSRRILERGARIRGARFHRRGRVIAELSFAGIHPRYPFLVALSQATMERLLARALETAGGVIERGVRMTACRNVAAGAEATLEPTGENAATNGDRETVRCPWMLAADGAHSVARRQMDIDFAGSAFNRDWYLVDAPLRTKLDEDHAHIFFSDAGEFQFLLRVIDDALNDASNRPVWRVLGNRPDPLNRLVAAEPDGAPVWTSRFRVAHRISAMLSQGAIHYAGDACHIHSPVGARGMNLGLEDAWVFAQLAQAGRLNRYDELRRPVDRQVVRRVDVLSRVASGESSLYRFLRSFVFPTAVTVPAVRARMLATLAGLDHDLPPELVAGAR